VWLSVWSKVQIVTFIHCLSMKIISYLVNHPVVSAPLVRLHRLRRIADVAAAVSWRLFQLVVKNGIQLIMDYSARRREWSDIQVPYVAAVWKRPTERDTHAVADSTATRPDHPRPMRITPAQCREGGGCTYAIKGKPAAGIDRPSVHSLLDYRHGSLTRLNHAGH